MPKQADLKQLSSQVGLEMIQKGCQLVGRESSNLCIQLLACQAGDPLAQKLRPLSVQAQPLCELLFVGLRSPVQ